MDTEKIRIYLTALETGSLSAAAEKLGYTISGISRSISALEAETGFPLLHRSRTGVSITQDAEQLLPTMRELVHLTDIYKDRCNSIYGYEIGCIHIGVCYEYYYPLVAASILRFRRSHPNIEIHMHYGISSELVEKLENHQIDLVIATQREGNYQFKLLQRDTMLACVPRNHPTVALGYFDMKLFETEPVIAPRADIETDYRRAFRHAGIHPNIQYTTNAPQSYLNMVSVGLGVTLANGIECDREDENLVYLPTVPSISLNIGILHPDISSMTIAGKEFLKVLSQIAEEMYS